MANCVVKLNSVSIVVIRNSVLQPRRRLTIIRLAAAGLAEMVDAYV